MHVNATENFDERTFPITKMQKHRKLVQQKSLGERELIRYAAITYTNQASVGSQNLPLFCVRVRLIKST